MRIREAQKHTDSDGSGTLLKVIKKSKTVKKNKQDLKGELEILLEFRSPS
jgi:hypothetical protein